MNEYMNAILQGVLTFVIFVKPHVLRIRVLVLQKTKPPLGKSSAAPARSPSSKWWMNTHLLVPRLPCRHLGDLSWVAQADFSVLSHAGSLAGGLWKRGPVGIQHPQQDPPDRSLTSPTHFSLPHDPPVPPDPRPSGAPCSSPLRAS